MLASAFMSDLISIRIRTDITFDMSVSTAVTDENVVSINTVTLLLLQIRELHRTHEMLSVPWLFASILIAESTIFIRLRTPRNSFAF